MDIAETLSNAGVIPVIVIEDEGKAVPLARTLAGGDWLTDFSFPPDKIYPQLCCIAYLLHSIDAQNTFTADLKALLAKYPTVDVAAMGFPSESWACEPLWR